MSAPATDDEQLSEGAGADEADELDTRLANRFAAKRENNDSGVNEVLGMIRLGARRTSRTLGELQAKAVSYARGASSKLAISFTLAFMALRASFLGF